MWAFKVMVTDSLGNVTRFAYDGNNQLVQTTYPDGSTEKRTYDLAGQLVDMLRRSGLRFCSFGD